jgi:hypothetical protein
MAVPQEEDSVRPKIVILGPCVPPAAAPLGTVCRLKLITVCEMAGNIALLPGEPAAFAL